MSDDEGQNPPELETFGEEEDIGLPNSLDDSDSFRAFEITPEIEVAHAEKVEDDGAHNLPGEDEDVGLPSTLDDSDPFRAFEIAPGEDIFSEFEVAQAEKVEDDGAQNLPGEDEGIGLPNTLDDSDPVRPFEITSGDVDIGLPNTLDDSDPVRAFEITPEDEEIGLPNTLDDSDPVRPFEITSGDVDIGLPNTLDNSDPFRAFEITPEGVDISMPNTFDNSDPFRAFEITPENVGIGLPNTFDDRDPFRAFEISPEDIFNEIKVAHAEKAEHDGAQNLHSFIISKSYSSENCVVLLNLRRLKDGEWVLDKTIAQGLKPETYGGVVSIDQYGFTDSASETLPSNSPSSRVSGTDDDTNENEKNIMTILKKMEDYVASVNKEIEAARNVVKSAPVCRDDPCTSKRAVAIKFEELPFTDKMIKMFQTFASEEYDTCNLCDDVGESGGKGSISTQTAITEWLRSLVGEISSFLGLKVPVVWSSTFDNNASSIELLSQSKALLEQAEQAGLLSTISLSGRTNSTVSGKAEADSSEQSWLLEEQPQNELEETVNIVRSAAEDLDFAD